MSDKSKVNAKKENEKTKEEPSSMFQRQRVDMLLGELLRKFPLPAIPSQQQQAVQQSESTPNQNGVTNNIETEPTPDIKQEPIENHLNNNGVKHNNDNDMDVDVKVEGDKNDMKPPPEKKIKPN